MLPNYLSFVLNFARKMDKRIGYHFFYNVSSGNGAAVAFSVVVSDNIRSTL
jgi:hypothetical protein